MMLWQAVTDATVASAANAAADQWTYEQWKDMIGYVIGLLVAAFLAWQNKILMQQNIVHEKNAQDRAELRGDPKPERRRHFPGEKRS